MTLKNIGRTPAKNVLLLLEIEDAIEILKAETPVHNNANVSINNSDVVVETAEILPGLSLNVDIDVEALGSYSFVIIDNTTRRERCA